ncbi:MAG TPA: histidinol dehydrogenase, partial [Candidatus Methylacidiphilales bacterium]|nr:histidinol dehydrogenase [Candidatus Methylacidiphilales bacterium]
SVRSIVEHVRTKGDEALAEFTLKFDKQVLAPADFKVTHDATQPTPEVLEALTYSLNNIRAFCDARRPQDWQRDNKEGARVGEMYRPFQRIGINVPGGTAPLVSSALMTVGIAREAGVPEIVVMTPPPVDSNLLFALRFAGATEVYQVGGAHAMAALAFGTPSIKRVQKIFGPGNAYVVEAKRQLVGYVAIDQLPGPSEIAVVADDTANAAFIAADLLAQAEHGPGSQIVLLTPSEALLRAVEEEMRVQLPKLSRQKHLADVLTTGSRFILTRDLAEALKLADDYAPEHLALVVDNAREIAQQIRNAGAIFIGNYSPVAAGDFLAGPSHTLPTGGAAKSFPGLTLDQFYRRTSLVEYSAKTLEPVVPFIETFSAIEKLDAHGRSARIRLES